MVCVKVLDALELFCFILRVPRPGREKEYYSKEECN